MTVVWFIYCKDCKHSEILPLNLDEIPTNETVGVNCLDAGIICRICKSKNIELNREVYDEGGEA